MFVLELKVLGCRIVFKDSKDLSEAWAIVVGVGSQNEVGMRIV